MGINKRHSFFTGKVPVMASINDKPTKLLQSDYTVDCGIIRLRKQA